MGQAVWESIQIQKRGDTDSPALQAQPAITKQQIPVSDGGDPGGPGNTTCVSSLHPSHLNHLSLTLRLLLNPLLQPLQSQGGHTHNYETHLGRYLRLPIDWRALGFSPHKFGSNPRKNKSPAGGPHIFIRK